MGLSLLVARRSSLSIDVLSVVSLLRRARNKYKQGFGNCEVANCRLHRHSDTVELMVFGLTEDGNSRAKYYLVSRLSR